MILQLRSERVDDLKTKLRELGLPVSGRKDDLIYRILDHHYTQRLNASSLSNLKSFAKKVGVPIKDNKDDMIKEMIKLSNLARHIVYPDIYNVDENDSDDDQGESQCKGSVEESPKNKDSGVSSGSKKLQSPGSQDSKGRSPSGKVGYGNTPANSPIRQRNESGGVPQLIFQIRLDPNDLNERSRSELSDLPMLVQRINTLLQGHLFASDDNDNIKASLLIEANLVMRSEYIN